MELPVRPWSKIASDIFVYQENHFLLIVDYYSKWPEIMILNLSLLQVINSLKSIFSKYGIPDVLISDNGPQYATKECRDSAKEYMYTFVHSTSSPLYPRSNGQAEILKKNKDPYKA